MIISRLKGGLGNQLFQYAVARHLAIKNHDKLWLDASYFTNYKLHSYSLGAFKIQANILSSQQLGTFLEQTHLVKRIIAQLSSQPTFQIIQERTHNFDSQILELQENLLLDGFWQSPKYFAAIQKTLRQDFQLALLQTGLDKQLAKKMTNPVSVSLHVRRGDYVTDPSASQHGTCDLKYYQSCINYMNACLIRPHFFIFSDDYEWSLKNFRFLKKVTFVHHNQADKNYNDLRLMSQCHHHIIANSTFSWWAAWLSEYSGQITLAPKKWYADPQIETDDLIPKNWKRL